MENNFVTFECAKALKEVGYNDLTWFSSCVSLYDKEGKHCMYANYGVYGSGLNQGYIPAPLWQESVKFLLDELDFYFPYVEYHTFNDGSGEWFSSGIDDNPELDVDFNSLEEAILNAVNTLKKERYGKNLDIK